MYDKYKTIAFERDGKVLTVRLNRPDELNAINGELHEELASVFADVDEDDEAHVIVLTGAGTAFSAGGDMAWLNYNIEKGDEFQRTARHAKRIVSSLLDCSKPIIARVNGPAIGLGASIALLSDLIYADENAVIADPHVRIGFVAGDGGPVIWPQLIGYARAKEYLLTGDAVKAKDAERMGLINRAVPTAELDEVTYKMAHRLANGATIAIRGTKKATNIGLKQLAESIMDLALSLEAQSNVSEDHKEGIMAFKEKRKPRFTGR